MKEISNIITEILNGDRSAERRLYDLFKTKWYMLAQRYCRTRDEANDIMQEGLIQIFKDIHQFDSTKAQFTTWSSRVMVNTALRYLKKNQWQDTFLDLDQNELIDQKDDDLYDSFAAKELTKMIQKLPIGYKIVFNMYVLEGYSHKEIAKELGIAVGTSKSQLSKAKRMLKHQLEKKINSYSNG